MSIENGFFQILNFNEYKNLDNVPAAAKVVGLASKKSVATDVKSLPNTGIDSAAMTSLTGVGLLLTLGTVKTKRRK